MRERLACLAVCVVVVVLCAGLSGGAVREAPRLVLATAVLPVVVVPCTPTVRPSETATATPLPSATATVLPTVALGVVRVDVGGCGLADGELVTLVAHGRGETLRVAGEHGGGFVDVGLPVGVWSVAVGDGMPQACEVVTGSVTVLRFWACERR